MPSPRARSTIAHRIVEVTNELLDRLEPAPHPDLVADAAPLPAEIIAEVLASPRSARHRMLERGEKGAPLLDIGVSWKTFRRGMTRYVKRTRIGDHIDQLRKSLETTYSATSSATATSPAELATTAALLAGAGFETTVNLSATPSCCCCNIQTSCRCCVRTPNYGPARWKKSCA